VNFSENGEKVLATSLTFGGKITFSTLVPEASSTGIGIDQCSAPVTQTRSYILNILSGASELYPEITDPNGTPGEPDIYVPGPPGIPNIPQRFFNEPTISGEPGGPKTCTHPVDLREGTKVAQFTGYDACTLESIYWSDPVSDE
jgi:Tfp pilus tip-associated adhesin PilY1